MSRLLDYLETRLGTYSGGSTGEYQFHCPFCIDRKGDESDQRKLWINIDKGMVVCYRCHYGSQGLAWFFRCLNGGVIRLEELRLLKGEAPLLAEGTTVDDAVYELLFSRSKPNVQTLKPVALPDEYVSLTQCYLGNRRARNYLKRRGIPKFRARDYSVGYCETGEYANFLIFPVFQFGQVVYFTNRYCGNRKLKTKNPPNVEGYYTAGSVLLNYDSVLGRRRVVLVEGAFDCMAYGRDAIASVGRTLSSAQVTLIEYLVHNGLQELVISYDSDAVLETKKAYEALVGRVPKVSVVLLDSGDPHERRRELKKLVRGRKELKPVDVVRATLGR